MCCVPPFFLCFLSLLWLLRGDSLGWHTIFTRDIHILYILYLYVFVGIYLYYLLYMRTIFLIISTKYFAVFYWDKAKLLQYFVVCWMGITGHAGHGGTNWCTNICIYFGILFNNFSLCPFSKYTNTRRGAQTHTRTHSQTHTDWSFLCAYVQREGRGGCVCCIFTIYILCIQSVLSAVALLSRIKSNRTIRQRCPVRSNSNDTMSAQRSGKVLESPPSMKNSNVLPRPNNFPPPNRECVCSESAREEVQKRAIERESARENVSCNWNMLLESE